MYIIDIFLVNRSFIMLFLWGYELCEKKYFNMYLFTHSSTLIHNYFI